MKRKDVIITCDSACDLTKKIINKNKIKVIPIQVLVGDNNYKDNGSMNSSIIYDTYRDKGILAKTAAFSPQTAIEFWEPFDNKGHEIVHISLSSELSSCYQNAVIASDEFSNVHVVDSKEVSAGFGLLVLEACKLRDRGFSAKEIVEQLEVFKEKIHLSFVINTLDFLHKGGRCSALTAMGANALQLKPCIESSDGKLKVTKKYRGTADRVYLKYLGEKLDIMEIDTNYEVLLVSSGEIDKKTLESIKDMAEGILKVDNISVIEAGCTICSHCGPKTLGIAFVKR